MTDPIERLAYGLVRLTISILLTVIALIFAAWIIPGMSFIPTALGPSWLQPFAAAILIGLINLLLRPLVLYISRPLGFFLLFLVGLLLNVAAVALASWILPGMQVTSFVSALGASIVVAAVNVLLASLLNLGDEDSYYRRRMEARAAATPFPTADEPGRKLVMLEIDGLSYHHLQHALAEGLMPTLEAMIKEEGYVLSRTDCGIPSQTSACQAGIMFGDNDDIPAFRWYDKTQQKLIVSSSDASELNSRYALGHGLMRGGSSISNMLNGDAHKSIMTAANLRTPDEEEARLRADDVYLLMLDPSFLLSTIARYLGMVGIEVWEGWQQRRRNVWPRLNRLAHFYPFVRAGTSVALRDLGASFVVMDILRGSPAIYVTWPGYDEVAHHSGPWTTDAFNDLARYDKIINRVRRTIKDKTPGDYDLIILSDHGQSFGPTFQQRYGISIKEFIESWLPEGTTITAAFGGDTGASALNSASFELSQAQEAGKPNRAASSLARQGARLAQEAAMADEARAAALLRPANVTAYGSGNLAQVYFDLFPRKITLTELNAAYPGVVDALLQHEGIGLVCGYLDDGMPVAMGKSGERNLHTGQVTGADPLLPYAPTEGYGASTVEVRAWQTRRVMDFPHAGDLMLISSVYPDGTVAALEELIGSHGGLGGEQTDAFIFHPPDMDVTETRNAVDVFHILNNHRGSPLPPPPTSVLEEPGTQDWQPHNLAAGLAMIGVWLSNLVRCILPIRSAYRAVVDDPLMTGPALLIGMAGTLLLYLAQGGITTSDWISIPLRLAWLFVTTIVLFGTGYFLTHKGTYARTFRAVGFAQSSVVLLVLALYAPIAHMVVIGVTILTFFNVWLGVALAHETRGWKTIVLPLIYLLFGTIGLAAIILILGGAAVSLAAVLETLGMQP